MNDSSNLQQAIKEKCPNSHALQWLVDSSLFSQNPNQWDEDVRLLNEKYISLSSQNVKISYNIQAQAIAAVLDTMKIKIDFDPCKVLQTAISSIDESKIHADIEYPFAIFVAEASLSKLNYPEAIAYHLFVYSSRFWDCGIDDISGYLPHYCPVTFSALRSQEIDLSTAVSEWPVFAMSLLHSPSEVVDIYSYLFSNGHSKSTMYALYLAHLNQISIGMSSEETIQRITFNDNWQICRLINDADRILKRMKPQKKEVSKRSPIVIPIVFAFIVLILAIIAKLL